MTPEFAKKHEEWVRCLGSEDRSAVLQQVYPMIWNAAAFRVINEARRHAPKTDRGESRISGLLHVLLDRCFFESQMLAVRRQLDADGLQGKRGVFSLRSLIDDMSTHRALFTRENFFASAKRVMDIAAAAAHEEAEFRKMIEAGANGGWCSMETDPLSIRELHETFDALSGVAAANRSPGDVISEEVFVGLKRQLSRIEKFIAPVNKLLAHAATPESRALVPPEELAVTLGDLWHAHEIICRCCQFIDCFLLRQTTHRFLALPGPDVLTHLEVPLATDRSKAALRDAWAAYEAETESWAETPLEWAFEVQAVAAPVAAALPETKADSAPTKPEAGE